MQDSKRRIRKSRYEEEIIHKLDLLQEPPNSSQISGGRWTYRKIVDLNPNAADIRITIRRSDDEFTDLFGTFLIITLMKQIWTLISTTWPSTKRTMATCFSNWDCLE